MPFFRIPVAQVPGLCSGMGAGCLALSSPVGLGSPRRSRGSPAGVRPALSLLHTSFAHQGRLVLSNKMARTIGFFYTLFLHCLVFLVSVQAGGQGCIQQAPLTSRSRRDPGTMARYPGHSPSPTVCSRPLLSPPRASAHPADAKSARWALWLGQQPCCSVAEPRGLPDSI